MHEMCDAGRKDIFQHNDDTLGVEDDSGVHWRSCEAQKPNQRYIVNAAHALFDMTSSLYVGGSKFDMLCCCKSQSMSFVFCHLQTHHFCLLK